MSKTNKIDCCANCQKSQAHKGKERLRFDPPPWWSGRTKLYTCTDSTAVNGKIVPEWGFCGYYKEA